jgi:predicted pyridoxine 5'-phosphate oxidase superfamily flavin-nucleotide-binding protein
MSNNSEIVFPPAAQQAQAQRGSAHRYERRVAAGFPDRVTPDLAAFIGDLDTAFLATVSAAGAPYIQHRGGPKGFLKVLDKQTLAFADYAGNQQFLTQGNLSENPRAYIFIMDYAHRRRVKIWGEARVVEDDAALTQSLMPKGYRARPEQVILFRITAWDTNCPQHIPQKFDAADVAAALAAKDQRIAELEAEVATLKGGEAGTS